MNEIQKMILCQLACDDPHPAGTFALFEKLHRRGLLADDLAGSMLLFMEHILLLENAELVEKITVENDVYHALSVEGRAVVTAMLKRLGTTLEGLKAMVTAALIANGLPVNDLGDGPTEMRRRA